MSESHNHGSDLPAPADLSGVVLSPEMEDLAERIAENTHNVWMQARLRDGWRWGPERSDRLRETPCLVPYDQLPADERAYDQAVAINAVKLTIALGYRIERD